MRRTKFIIKWVLLLFCSSFILFQVQAQPGDPGGGGPPVPLGGIEYLIGLGALYGVRQILKKLRSK